MKNLIQSINKVINLSPEAESYLHSISTVKKVAKGTVLIKEGLAVKKIYYIIDGCLRSYCTDKNGKESTLQFGIRNWWISDYTAVHTGESAILNVECLMDSEVIEFSADKLNGIFSRFPEYEPFHRVLLERHVVSLHKRILNQLQLTAAERYALFLEQYPDIERYARNYHIASYLGITQESLSRVRVENTRK